MMSDLHRRDRADPYRAAGAGARGRLVPGDQSGTTAEARDRRIDRLIERLPGRLPAGVRWLRRPSARWVRIPAGSLFVFGGILGVLPVLGIWMLPLGLMLLAEDAPPLRRALDRLLDRIERRWPHWVEGGGR